MNTTIKKRIEEINSGRVPEGYEKTSFGIFPCDWEKSKTLKDLGKFGKGRGIPGNKLISEGVPCVGYGDIYMKYNYHFEKAQSFVDENTAAESQKIRKGTLLFTATGETAEEIGKCVCYNGEEDIYAGGDIITFIPDRINSMFIAYQQYQNYALRQKASFGQGHSVVHIQKDRLEKLHIAYPQSAQEQSRIAEILMQWDKAIELQEKYIKQLELRKKALMQRLLTPKEGWEERNLYDICKIETGKLDVNAMAEDGEYPFFTCSKQVYKIDKYAYDCEALLMAGNGDIGDIKYYNGKFNAYQRTYVLHNFSCDIKYVMYFLQQNFDRAVMRGTQRSSMPFIKLELLKETIIKIPKNKNFVVEILSQSDIEISLQTQKLDKLIKQRKALQQYLLTGIVRV